jgi:hypothetical protein
MAETLPLFSSANTPSLAIGEEGGGYLAKPFYPPQSSHPVKSKKLADAFFLAGFSATSFLVPEFKRKKSILFH